MSSGPSIRHGTPSYRRVSGIRPEIHTVVITTGMDSVELAADALRSRGAAAVEERLGLDPNVVEVVAVLGEPVAGLGLVVEALAETRENKTIARIEWQMRGRRRLILAVQEVTQ